MAFAKTSHGKIFYQIKGNGPVIVLLRGLGRWSEHWNGFDVQLSKHARVITMDPYGLGQTSVPMRPWHGVKDLATAVSIVLKTERIETAHIVGVSLGGMIAIEFALAYPSMTQSVTAINSSVGKSGHMRLTIAALELLAKAPLLQEKIYPTLARLLTSPQTSPATIDALAENWRAVDAKYPKSIAVVMLQLASAMRWDHWKDFPKITAPVQLIAGDDDQFVPRGNSLFLANKIPGSKIVALSKAGHEPHIDRPQALEEAILSFIKTA